MRAHTLVLVAFELISLPVAVGQCPPPAPQQTIAITSSGQIVSATTGQDIYCSPTDNAIPYTCIADDCGTATITGDQAFAQINGGTLYAQDGQTATVTSGVLASAGGLAVVTAESAASYSIGFMGGGTILQGAANTLSASYLIGVQLPGPNLGSISATTAVGCTVQNAGGGTFEASTLSQVEFSKVSNIQVSATVASQNIIESASNIVFSASQALNNFIAFATSMNAVATSATSNVFVSVGNVNFQAISAQANVITTMTSVTFNAASATQNVIQGPGAFLNFDAAFASSNTIQQLTSVSAVADIAVSNVIYNNQNANVNFGQVQGNFVSLLLGQYVATGGRGDQIQGNYATVIIDESNPQLSLFGGSMSVTATGGEGVFQSVMGQYTGVMPVGGQGPNPVTLRQGASVTISGYVSVDIYPEATAVIASDVPTANVEQLGVATLLLYARATAISNAAGGPTVTVSSPASMIVSVGTSGQSVIYEATPYSPGVRRRHIPVQTQSACGVGRTLCPSVVGLGAYSCVDTSIDVMNCGGCAATGSGVDCTAFSDGNVSCMDGQCVEISSEWEYEKDTDSEVVFWKERAGTLRESL